MSNLARNAAWTFIVQIVLLLCSADRIAQAQEMSAKDVFNKWHSAVVTIQTDAKSGTGFLDSYGFLHTAYHVLDGCSSATAIFSDGRQEPIVAVNSASKERDVAIVTTAYSHSPGPQLGDYSATVPGERVVVIGSPLGLSQTVTEGIVSAKRNENGVDMLQLSAGISPGSSGSPAFNSKGEVIGMVVSTLKDGQTLNFAVAGKDLKYYRGVELKTVFSPGSEALSQKSPSRSSAFSSELSSLNSIFSLQKTLSVDAYKIANSPDFAIGVDTYNYGSDQHADLSKWVDANGARTIILEEILRSAPKAKVLDDDLLKRRMAETIEKDKTRWQDSDTNVLSWLYSRDEVDRKLVVKIYYTPLESSYSPDNQGILVIAVSFNRVALTEYGFDEITAYSESQSENVRRGDVATNVLEGLLKSSIHKFAEKWAVANTVVIPAIISGK